MIESEILAPEAVELLNQAETEGQEEAAKQARFTALEGLLGYCNEWIERAKQFRSQSYESDWLLYQRNSDSIFDPEVAKKKKAWQAKAFVDLTPSHRENIHAALYKLHVGSQPPLEMDPRSGGDKEQAENAKDLITRELEKSRFPVEYDSILEDADTYGSGIARLRWEERYEDRVIREPVPEPVSLLDPGSVVRKMSGQPKIIGYVQSVQPQLIYRGTRIEHISIWDFFWDPKALKIEGTTVAVRFKLSKGQIEAGVQEGYYFPEAWDILKDAQPDEAEQEDRAQSNAQRGIADTPNKRTEYGQEFTAYEMHARLPQKFVFPFTGQEITNPEKLIPARVIFHGSTICAVELNTDYRGEPPYEKLDYMRVNGRFIGRGIPEMLKHPQKIINEVVNQRLDEGNLTLNSKTVVIEKAVLNPKELEEGGPGVVIRLDNKWVGPNGDVRNAVMQLESSDVHVRAGFSEVTEWERFAQERTSQNRVTNGTAGMVNDTNDTLGGMELLKQSAGEKFAYLAMVQEYSFLVEVYRRYWSLIYGNIQPEDVLNVLGPERTMTFQLMSPEEIDRDYKYTPQGIFEMENKAVLQARLQSLFAQFQAYPWLDPMKNFDLQAKTANVDPDTLKYSPQEMQMMMQAQAQIQQAQQPLPEPKPPTPGEPKGAKK